MDARNRPIVLMVGFLFTTAGIALISLHWLAARAHAQDSRPLSARKDARELALRCLNEAAAFDRLPRFQYRVRYRHGTVDAMRSVTLTLNQLKEGLTGPVLEKDWFGWYEDIFSWDLERFLWEMNPGDTTLGFTSCFWTRKQGWERNEAKDRDSRNFVRMNGPDNLWKSLVYFDFGYLRVTPHRFWWGVTTNVNSQTMSLVPADRVAWNELGAQVLGGKACRVLDCPRRNQRLWIHRDSGHIRAALTYYMPVNEGLAEFHKSESVKQIAGQTFATQFDYVNWLRVKASADQLIEIALAATANYPESAPEDITPNELVLFDDYREVTAGVWIPFREVRTFPHASETVPGTSKVIRSELRVEEARTDINLTDRYNQLLPHGADPVQDRR